MNHIIRSKYLIILVFVFAGRLHGNNSHFQVYHDNFIDNVHQLTSNSYANVAGRYSNSQPESFGNEFAPYVAGNSKRGDNELINDYDSDSDVNLNEASGNRRVFYPFYVNLEAAKKKKKEEKEKKEKEKKEMEMKEKLKMEMSKANVTESKNLVSSYSSYNGQKIKLGPGVPTPDKKPEGKEIPSSYSSYSGQKMSFGPGSPTPDKKPEIKVGPKAPSPDKKPETKQSSSSYSSYIGQKMKLGPAVPTPDKKPANDTSGKAMTPEMMKMMMMMKNMTSSTTAKPMLGNSTSVVSLGMQALLLLAFVIIIIWIWVADALLKFTNLAREGTVDIQKRAIPGYDLAKLLDLDGLYTRIIESIDLAETAFSAMGIKEEDCKQMAFCNVRKIVNVFPSTKQYLDSVGYSTYAKRKYARGNLAGNQTQSCKKSFEKCKTYRISL